MLTRARTFMNILGTLKFSRKALQIKKQKHYLQGNLSLAPSVLLTMNNLWLLTLSFTSKATNAPEAKKK